MTDHLDFPRDMHPYDWMAAVKAQFDAGERPTTITGPLGTHGCMYDDDSHDGGGEYVVVGLILPEGIYAEIEDGTYGTMQGIRISLEPLCPSCGLQLFGPPDERKCRRYDLHYSTKED